MLEHNIEVQRNRANGIPYKNYKSYENKNGKIQISVLGEKSLFLTIFI